MSPGSMTARPRLFPLLLVVAAVILVPAIAFASSPDPRWLEGVCNDADGDDLLSLVDDIDATDAAYLPHMSPPPHFYKAAFTLRPSMTSSDPANRFTRGPPLRPVYMLNTTRSRLLLPCQPLHLPQPPRPTRADTIQAVFQNGVALVLQSLLLDRPLVRELPDAIVNNSPLHRSERRCGQTQSSSLRGGCHGQEEESRLQNRA